MVERAIIELPRTPSSPDFAVSPTGRWVFVAGIGILDTERQSVEVESVHLENCMFCKDESSAYGIIENQLFWIRSLGKATELRLVDPNSAASTILAVPNENAVVWSRENQSGTCEIVYSDCETKPRVLYPLQDEEFIPDTFSRTSTNWLLTCSSSAISDHADTVRDLMSGTLVCGCPRAILILPEVSRFIRQTYLATDDIQLGGTEMHFSEDMGEGVAEYSLWDFKGRRLGGHAFPIGTLVSVHPASDQSLCFLKARMSSDRKIVIGFASENGEKKLVMKGQRSCFASQRHIFILDKTSAQSQLQVLDRNDLRPLQVFPDFANDICMTSVDESVSFFFSQVSRTLDLVTHSP